MIKKNYVYCTLKEHQCREKIILVILHKILKFHVKWHLMQIRKNHRSYTDRCAEKKTNWTILQGTRIF